jgi:methylisocitrate lyase
MKPSPAARAAQFRRLLSDAKQNGTAIAMPGAINALSARLIEQMDFDALYLSGAVLANSVGGVPDTGLMTLSEAEHHAQHVSRVTGIPALMDADTGFGERDNTARTVQVLEHAGVAAVHLEDQEFPKRCGHLEGKRLVPAEAFCEKIAAAAEARSSKDFLIVARTDARSVSGYDEAVRRAHMYLEAGAEAIFPEALETEEEFVRFARDVDTHLLANMTEFGRTPFTPVEQFAEMGYRMVIFPVTLQRVAMKAMTDVLADIRATGTQAAFESKMQTRQELYDLLGYDGKVGKGVPGASREKEKAHHE